MQQVTNRDLLEEAFRDRRFGQWPKRRSFMRLNLLRPRSTRNRHMNTRESLRDDHRGLPLRPYARPGAAVRRGFNFPSSERRAHQHQHRLSRRIATIAGRGPRPRLAHRRASPQAWSVQAPAGRSHRARDGREALSADRPPDSSLTNASTRRIVRLGSWLVERFGSYMIAFDPRRELRR